MKAPATTIPDIKVFEPLAGGHEDELLAHLAADAQLVPYQPGMVLPGQVVPARGVTGGSSSGRHAQSPVRDPARR